MSCVPPCLTCTAATFSSCSTCDTSIDSTLTLDGSLCVKYPIWFIQLACTCMLALFILFPLLRKRSMVLMRIFDVIQTASYLKYVNAYCFYRHNYLYLGMNGVFPWSQGIKLISFSQDQTIAVYTLAETYLNMLVRIACIWLTVILLLLVVALFKACCSDNRVTFTTFMSKNIPNALSICFYITIQDISFYIFLNIFSAIHQVNTFANYMQIIFFVFSIILVILIIILIVWLTTVVNSPLQHLHQYRMMFMLRMDYDLFQNYSLTHLPNTQKLIHRYSNVAIIELIKKIGFSAIMAYNLFITTTLEEEMLFIIGYLLLFMLLWYVALPFDQRKQVLQLILSILADLVLLFLIIFPLVVNRSEADTLYMIVCLSLFGLAFLSGLLQVVMDLYCFIPYDLYQTGMKIVIQDQKLKKQLQERRQQQQMNQRKIKGIQDQAQKQKTKTILNKASTKRAQTQLVRQNQSQESIVAPKDQINEQAESVTNVNNNILYPVQQISNNSDDLGQYKIDLHKRRKVYAFDKKKPFVYSNKVQS